MHARQNHSGSDNLAFWGILKAGFEPIECCKKSCSSADGSWLMLWLIDVSLLNPREGSRGLCWAKPEAVPRQMLLARNETEVIPQ